MKRYFVDTNIFLRYLVNDESDHADRVEKLLNKAERGQIKLVTGPPVYFELAWTLKSFYKMDKNAIYNCLLSIVGIKGLDVTDIDVVTDALEAYRKHNVEFTDAYISVLSKKLVTDGLVTFNKNHFNKLDIQLYPI